MAASLQIAPYPQRRTGQPAADRLAGNKTPPEAALICRREQVASTGLVPPVRSTQGALPKHHGLDQPVGRGASSLLDRNEQPWHVHGGDRPDLVRVDAVVVVGQHDP